MGVCGFVPCSYSSSFLLLLLPWVFVGLFLRFVFDLGLVGLENEEQRKKRKNNLAKEQERNSSSMSILNTPQLCQHIVL